ncbi:hypothetical protein FRX31_026074 [Thalictrum thalictroides]|uniref:Uncharacterized protein n=1 Tax=Thalictrum thalictroides TaxID=46969 RepID=A0A7J6VGU5_THATH|nr:hypothetical protein FRX31_026074 [Thalictrum thalictroides]
MSKSLQQVTGRSGWVRASHSIFWNGCGFKAQESPRAVIRRNYGLGNEFYFLRGNQSRPSGCGGRDVCGAFGTAWSILAD